MNIRFPRTRFLRHTNGGSRGERLRFPGSRKDALYPVAVVLCLAALPSLAVVLRGRIRPKINGGALAQSWFWERRNMMASHHGSLQRVSGGQQTNGRQHACKR
ncbi:Hypothetical protein CpE19_1500 [Corynebacterium pseudotuberculosis]|nr:Hypothetical protein CpE19_1500 [Corynebacterium pseudotuberculosis]